MSDSFEDVGEGDDFDYCPHGRDFSEECEACEEEDDAYEDGD